MGRAYVAACLLASIGANLSCGDNSPLSPTRYGAPSLMIHCDVSGASPLRCVAPVDCGDYGCAPDVPADVTQVARWVSADPTIVRVVAPGEMVSVSPGDTYLKVTWGPHASAYGEVTVSAFPGTAPLPTFDISGAVYDAGGALFSAPIKDAFVEVIDGRFKGRSVQSGSEPVRPPGFYTPPAAPGGYYLLGTPVGHYRLRVSKTGYISQERDVALEGGGSKVENFALSRQP